MKIRHINLSDKHRKRLMDLVQEASAELDQVSSDEELDRLESELSDQLKYLLEDDNEAVNEASGFDENKFTQFKGKKKHHNFWTLPGLGLVALLVLSFVGIHSLPGTEETMVTKGFMSDFPCDIQFIQTCSGDQNQLHIQDLTGGTLTILNSQPVYIAAACPHNAPLTLFQPLTPDSPRLVTDPVQSQMNLLIKGGQRIQLDPSLQVLQISFGNATLSVEFALVQDASLLCPLH